MARPIWSGVISFGLVSVPVAMYSATQEHEVPFHQFEKGTGDRIRYQRINERTGKEVEYEDIVKGADVGGGDYVMVEREELDEIAPGRSRSLEIHQFVDLGEVDPIYFQKTYYLGPGGEETNKAYVLLRDSLAEADLAAIGTLVMRGKEYLTAVRADGPLLVLETMFFADEVRDPKDVVDPMPGRVKPRPQELRMASQLIESMTAKWVPQDYRDSYTDRVKDLIATKEAGDEVVPTEEAPEATDTSDLMEALRRSVEATRKGRHSTAEKASTKKASAEKASASKKGPAPKKASATKAPASKKASAKKAPARAASSKAAPKKAGAKKTTSKKAASQKAPAKKAA